MGVQRRPGENGGGQLSVWRRGSSRRGAICLREPRRAGGGAGWARPGGPGGRGELSQGCAWKGLADGATQTPAPPAPPPTEYPYPADSASAAAPFRQASASSLSSGSRSPWWLPLTGSSQEHELALQPQGDGWGCLHPGSSSFRRPRPSPPPCSAPLPSQPLPSRPRRVLAPTPRGRPPSARVRLGAKARPGSFAG